MSCEDIPSLLDLQKVKKHADDFGRLMGTGTGTSTNEVTGQVRPTYNKVIADMNSEFDAQIINKGFTRIGTFSTGATLTNPRQTLLWDIADGGDGQEYGWSGSFLPSGKVVPPGSTPLTTGGIAVGAWMSRFDPALRVQTREALRRSYAEAGYNLVDGSFEAGGTLVNANDVLLQEHTGKAFSGHAGAVAAGTAPASGGFVDRSGEILRSKLASSGGMNLVNDEYRRTFYLRDDKWGLSESVTADNTNALSLIFANMPDNTVLDFGGMALRILSSVSGITSSAANPATDDALPLNQCVVVNGKKNIRFKNGVIYSANAGTAPVKSYFPSAVSFINCRDIDFDNFTGEAKGESWGDADASLSQPTSRRLIHSVTNGGHAIFFGRCRGITGRVNGRLCGSTASLYFSSCTGVKLDTPFANCASLGYNPICFDSWVGTLAETGFNDFLATIVNPILRKETLFRREDGTTAVGSSAYAGKGGILTEGAGVQCYSVGGDISDMYSGGGATPTLGYSFGASDGTINKNVGARVRNCQEIIFLDWSTAKPSVCMVENVDAIVGLTGVMVNDKSFGTGYAKLTGNVVVDGSRVWAGHARTDLQETSLVCLLKPTSEIIVDLDCVCPREGLLQVLISNKQKAVYGAIRFLGGVYHTDGYFCRSVGIGGASDSAEFGIFAIGACKFIEDSDVALPWIEYTNKSPNNTLTYINHDLANAEFVSLTFRQLDGYNVQGAGLVRRIRLPNPAEKFYVSTATRSYNKRDTYSCWLTCVSVDGLSGPNSLITFRLGNNTALGGSARIINGANLHRIIGASGSFTDRADDATTTYRDGATRQYILDGDVRSQYSAGSSYVVIGA